tara:strand:+ start:11245 stop:11706 length:462 start_codon:yes stop_codon:yes gene_type:complete
MSEEKTFLLNYEKEKSEGYYILNLNGFTSYIYYKPQNSKIDVIFGSKNLSVEEVRNFLENMGKTINLKSVNSKEDIFLDPYIGYVKSSNYEDYIDKEKGVYKVVDHILPFMYNLTQEAEKLNLVDIVNRNLLEKTNKVKKTPIQKPSTGIKNN